MIKKIEDINNNPLSRAWEERYNSQTAQVKKKLDELDQLDIKDYQLKIIKRKRTYPEVGDLFLLQPIDGIYFAGLVINNHVDNINGDELLVIVIFDTVIKEITQAKESIDFESLLISPCIVGKEYWNRGYFFTIDNIPGKQYNYGFYRICSQKYLNEYGMELAKIPELIGTFGVSTISGIARKINVELIIRESELFNNN